MEYAVELNGLCKNYGAFQLKDVSFTVPKGAIVGFIGENGAGKSTTIKLMLNLISRDGGTVTIFGRDAVREEKAVKEEIGVVLDECAFPEALKLRQIASILRPIFSAWDDSLFEKLCGQLRLPPDKPVKDFSRGMKMKLSIAAALAHRPKLLVLDEATSGLDPVVRNEVLDLFYDFIQDEEHSILMSSHITSDLDKIADYVVLLHGGQVRLREDKATLSDQYGVVKCRKEDISRLLDRMGSQVISTKTGAFGAEALVKNRREAAALLPQAVIDPASIEDIMLFLVKGEQK